MVVPMCKKFDMCKNKEKKKKKEPFKFTGLLRTSMLSAGLWGPDKDTGGTRGDAGGDFPRWDDERASWKQ